MSRRDHRVTVRQIIDYVHRAQALCKNKSAAQIEASWRDALALERAMEVLGEAVKRLPEELIRRYPQVPWRLVAGMRDKISHGYDTVDHQTLCDAVKNDLPQLSATAEMMLRELDDAPASGNDASKT
ncbi:MAG TPA: HepT-like ribonuclease domain-containing protein [Steroidobacteraceae bacterium]|nr:HepT-like ribonuclease domain-containing protein [Steroidobacteraceae bacterium]